MRALAIIIVIVSASFGAYWLFAPDTLKPNFLQSDAGQFCNVCEETFLERLRSPSTYVRHECSGPYDEVSTRETYSAYDRDLDWESLEDWRRQYLTERGRLITTVFLKYDAANGFGTPIRGAVSCQIDRNPEQSLIDASRIFGPRVDGYNKLEWTLELLRRAQGQ